MACMLLMAFYCVLYCYSIPFEINIGRNMCNILLWYSSNWTEILRNNNFFSKMLNFFFLSLWNKFIQWNLKLFHTFHLTALPLLSRSTSLWFSSASFLRKLKFSLQIQPRNSNIIWLLMMINYVFNSNHEYIYINNIKEEDQDWNLKE